MSFCAIESTAYEDSSEKAISDRVKSRKGLIVVLEGNIGTGKSTLLKRIHNEFIRRFGKSHSDDKKVAVFF